MASEAAEAGFIRLITSALMSKGCMQSFDLLALKLRPWCSFKATYRHSFLVFLYIVRYVLQFVIFLYIPSYEILSGMIY